MKRFLSLVLLSTLLVGLLAACGGQTPATDTGATQPTTAAPAEEPTAMAEEPTAMAEEPTAMAEEPTAMAEEATAAPEATAEGGAATGGEAMPDVSGIDLGTVKIASQSPLSGPQSALGTSIRNGAQLAIKQKAEQMGFTGLELVPYDDQATENVGASNANQIAADQDVLCVVGHLNSGVALAALPTYQNATLAMVSPANTNPRITEEFGANPAFRVVGRDDVQGVVAENFARDTLQAQSVYVLHDQTAYGEGVANFFRQAAEEDGLNVAGFAGTQETSAFDAVLTPIQAANPDVVFFGGIYSQAGPLLQQMRERGIQAKFLGPDGMDSSEFSRLAGEAAVGANYTTVAGPPSEYPAAAQFAQDYQAEYGSAAPSFSPQAYDAAGLCMTAIANAALEANGKPTRQQVIEALKNLGTYEGVTGTIQFDDKGDRAPATYFVLEVASADPEAWGDNTVLDTLEVSPPEQ